MKKKVLAALLSAAMVMTSLIGCGGGAADSASSTENAETKQEAATEENEEATGEEADGELSLAEQAIADRKAKAEETGEYEKVVVSFFDWTGAPVGIDRVNAKLSEYTREKLGVDMELLIIDVAAYTEDLKLMLSSGEQVDLFSTCGPGYMTCVNNGYTADLEEDGLLDNYGADLKNLIRTDYLDACRVGDTLYGVPPIKDYAIQTACILIGTEYLEGAGVDLSKFEKDELGYNKATWDDVDEMFAAIHEAYPDKIVYSTQDNLLTQGSCVDNIAGDYFGCLLDPANSLEIENVYESDLFREWADRAYRWNQLGYISGDAMTDDNGASSRIKSGAYMAMMAQAKPAYQNQINGECGRDMTIFDVGDAFMGSSAVSAFPWCMNQATEDPNVLWLMPNQYAAHVWEGDPIDVGEQTAAFNDNCKVKSKALGFTWDNSDYVAEFTALQNAYKEFGPQVVYGFIDPDTGLKQLNDALYAAGLQEYMDAKQEALNEWAK